MKTENRSGGEGAAEVLCIPALRGRLPDGGVPAGELADIVAEEGITVDVGIADWHADYPYTPKVTATLAHDGDCLYSLFNVSERHLRVATLHDNGPVWEDSCVELFVADSDGRHYYNFEINAAGVALASRRVSRTECEHFPPELMRRILRISSRPMEKADKRDDNGVEWTLLVGIPFNLFAAERPETLRINIYKCGDKTDTPHFLSWAPVNTPSPDFHRPEFFRQVRLL